LSGKVVFIDIFDGFIQKRTRTSRWIEQLDTMDLFFDLLALFGEGVLDLGSISKSSR
jgi:hypothetical protein